MQLGLDVCNYPIAAAEKKTKEEEKNEPSHHTFSSTCAFIAF